MKDTTVAGEIVGNFSWLRCLEDEFQNFHYEVYILQVLVRGLV